jgi:hypothetical protein
LIITLDSTLDTNSNVYSNPELTQHSSSYVNHPFPSNNSEVDGFYVTPRQENLPICDTHNTITSSSEDNNPSTPPNPADIAQFYATPPTFSKNFVLESNLSFDDSQDVQNISLDSVPDILNDTSTTNIVYYSYPEQQSVTVNHSFSFFVFF